MKLIDISLTIQDGMMVYPGNPPVCIKQVQKIPKNSTNVSQLIMGSHTGTHLDAPKHINNKGKGVDQVPLARFYGPSQVLDLTRIPFGKGIEEEHLKKFKITKNIILLRTKNSKRGYKKFHPDFVYLTEDGAKYLLKKGVKTVGVDYLSIQQFHSGYCAAHCVLLNKNVAIFEGLNLSKAKAGTYTFIGLPLKIKNGDGAPARALLIK